MSFGTASSRTIYVADVIVAPNPDRGRGIFARCRFEPNEIIKVCPMIALSERDAERLDETGLSDYYFGWGKDGKPAAIAPDSGSLYNRSITANAEHRKNAADDTISIVALREIAAGGEIFIH